LNLNTLFIVIFQFKPNGSNIKDKFEI